MDLPLLKNDITTILRPQKRVIYSRYLPSAPIKNRAIADPALAALKASLVSRHH
jgi:hypothetical protein